LHLSLIHFQWKTARFLIDHGAGIHIQDGFGNTALHYACHQDDDYLDEQLGFVHTLIKFGACACTQNTQGDTALHIASKYRNFDKASALLTNGILFGDHGNSQNAQANTKSGADGFIDVNIQNNNGNTPLHEACARGHDEVAWLLMEHGTDMTIKNSINLTAAHIASARSYVDLAFILFSRNILDAVSH
jgi:ankyrin repeat protein